MTPWPKSSRIIKPRFKGRGRGATALHEEELRHFAAGPHTEMRGTCDQFYLFMYLFICILPQGMFLPKCFIWNYFSANSHLIVSVVSWQYLNTLWYAGSNILVRRHWYSQTVLTRNGFPWFFHILSSFCGDVAVAALKSRTINRQKGKHIFEPTVLCSDWTHNLDFIKHSAQIN